MINESELIDLVFDALGVNKDSIRPESQSHEIPEWDSLGHLSILSLLQQKLGDRYQENQELASATSIKELLECLNK